MYALSPARRTAQIAGDVGVLCWCLAWAQAARVVHGLVVGLAEPARRLQQSAGEFSTAVGQAGDSAAAIPFAGAPLREAFDRVAVAGAEAAAAGADFETTVARLALALALVVALAPGLGLAVPYLTSRARFARRASAARRFVDAEDDLDLFALRALANQPLPRLAAISDDPAGAWRAGDRRVVHALAALELRSVGLRPPVTGPASRP